MPLHDAWQDTTCTSWLLMSVKHDMTWYKVGAKQNEICSKGRQPAPDPEILPNTRSTWHGNAAKILESWQVFCKTLPCDRYDSGYEILRSWQAQ